MSSGFRHRLLKELAFVLVLGTPVLLFFLMAAPRSHATRLLRQLHTIQAGHARFNDALRLSGQFSGDAACVGDTCVFQFQNTWMHRFHLAPMTEFTVMFQRSGSAADPGGGGVASVNLAMLVRNNDGNARASALVFDRNSSDAYRASITFGVDNKPLRTVVVLSQSATGRQRARARAFNLACLTRFGGCQTSRDLLPDVWQGVERIQEATAPASAFRNRRTASATVAAAPMHPMAAMRAASSSR